MSEYENIDDIRPAVPPVQVPPSSQQQTEGEDKEGLAIAWYMRFVAVPVILFYYLGTIARDNVTQNLILEKVCRFYSNLDPDMCDSKTMNATTRLILQKNSILVNMFAQMIQLTPGALLSLFLGPWIDYRGARNLLMFPIIGNFLSTIVYYLCVQFWPDFPPEMILVASLPVGLSGSKVIFSMALYKYVANFSTKSTKSVSFVIVDASAMVAMPLGSFLGGLIYEKSRYSGLFSFAAGMQMASLVFLFLMPSDYQNNPLEDGPSCSCSSFFSLSNIKDSFYAVFRSRPLNRTKRIVLLIATLAIFSLILMSVDMNIQFFYLSTRLNWSLYENTVYMSWNIAVMSLGSVLEIAILSYCLKVPDDCIVLLGAVVRIISLVMFGVCSFPELIYAVGGISFFFGATFPALRSQLSKLADQDEEGKVFAVVTSAESCLPIFGIPLFSVIYNATLGLDMGVVYYTSAGLTGLSLIFITLHIFYRIQANRQIFDKKHDFVHDNLYFSSSL